MNTPAFLAWATALLTGAVTSVSAIETVIRYPAPEQHNLNTVCWTGTHYVAAGDLGAVFTSPDGIDWIRRPVPGTPNIAASAAGSGRTLLGTKASLVLTSTDGLVWAATSLPGPHPEWVNVAQLAWSGVSFRAISTGGENWASADGLVWTPLTTVFLGRKLAVDKSSFVAWPYSASSGNQQLFRDSGTGWNSSTTDLAPAMWNLVWNGDRYISVGPAGSAATSIDGSAWTLRSTGVTANLEQVIWTEALAVAIGAGGKIITSPDGATWTERTSGTNADLKCIAAGSSSMIAVGKGGVILRSADGITWSVIRASHPPLNVTGLAWTGTGVLAVADPHATLTSPDGLTWTRTGAVTGPRGSGLRVIQAAGKLVASDGGWGLWTALPDAAAWTDRAQQNIIGTSTVWDGQQFVALCQGWHPRFNSMIFYTTRSPDGVAWAPLAYLREDLFETPESRPKDDLLFTGSRFLCSTRQSNDAITWTTSAVPAYTRFLLATGSGYLAVNFRGAVHTSPDGVVWTESVPASFSPPGGMDPLRGVVWTGYRLLAVEVGVNGKQGVWDGGPGRPWTKIHPVGGISIAWTGTRALVSSGGVYNDPPHIFSLDNIETSLPPTWSYWQKTSFTAAQMADPSISGPLADADGDGHTNVEEFMSASSPVSGQDRPWSIVLPPQDGQGTRFQWRQDTGRNGVTVRAEVCTNPDLWDTVSFAPVDGSPGGLRMMQATAPAGLGRTWFRLRVTLHE